jgi:hypothetical protein
MFRQVGVRLLAEDSIISIAKLEKVSREVNVVASVKTVNGLT